jgi:hypothetical protein
MGLLSVMMMTMVAVGIVSVVDGEEIVKEVKVPPVVRRVIDPLRADELSTREKASERKKDRQVYNVETGLLCDLIGDCYPCPTSEMVFFYDIFT